MSLLAMLNDIDKIRFGTLPDGFSEEPDPEVPTDPIFARYYRIPDLDFSAEHKMYIALVVRKSKETIGKDEPHIQVGPFVMGIFPFDARNDSEDFPILHIPKLLQLSITAIKLHIKAYRFGLTQLVAQGAEIPEGITIVMGEEGDGAEEMIANLGIAVVEPAKGVN